MRPHPFGVYFHVPFCVSRCDYCAFATWTDRFHLVDQYVAGLVTVARRRLTAERAATSVFFGGGTPSLLTPEHMASVLAAVPLTAGPSTGERPAEVTVECNPETVDEAKLTGYREAGVNRLSFGVQSMAPHVLAGLGRRHDPEGVHRAVAAAAAAGFGGNYSVDLIMGGAGESLYDWRTTVQATLALDPTPSHVSAYGLTVEAGTPLAADPTRHPDPDDQADKYLLADELLRSAGFDWYEISNWARPGAECRHNQLYWSQGEYEGIGCAAHSHRIDPETGYSQRWWNACTPERWLALVEDGGTGRSAGETLECAESNRERLQLALRTSTGVPPDALPNWPDDPDLAGLVEPTASGHLVLTARGRLLANEVSLRLA